MKHTPGPWTASPMEDAEPYWEIHAQALPICDGMDKDDARLIAKAPEMYEAVLFLLEHTPENAEFPQIERLLKEIDND